MINNYNDFITNLIKSGFSMGSNNSEGIFSLFDKNFITENIVWHTENIDNDPWEWRMRVVEERDDIAYSKFFFKKNGYITKEWYPYFLSVRRGKKTLDEEYFDGNVSIYSKNIYDLIKEKGSLPLHIIKSSLNLSKEDKSKFDSALTELQMKFYITICGRMQKISKNGDEFGWSSTVFTLVENFFDENLLAKSYNINAEEAFEKIKNQAYILNPNLNQKKLIKFIKG